MALLLGLIPLFANSTVKGVARFVAIVRDVTAVVDADFLGLRVYKKEKRRKTIVLDE